jgi:hypothetical protein
MNEKAPESTKYFMTLYGAQRLSYRPKYSHTYATFTEKATARAPRELTISWLPADGVIKPNGPPERGLNYTWDETLDWLRDQDSDIQWASRETEIQKEFFQSAEKRFEELKKGTLKYVMIDRRSWRPDKASNCIHAVTDIPLALTQFDKLRTYTLHGIVVSRYIYEKFSHFYVNKEEPIQFEDDYLEDIENYGLRAARHASFEDSLRALACARKKHLRKRPKDSPINPPSHVISVMVAVTDAPKAVAWYKQALGARELWNLGSVVGLEIDGAPFFVGEPANNGWESPEKLGITSARIEVFRDDPDAFIARAVAAGADGRRDGIRDHATP